MNWPCAALRGAPLGPRTTLRVGGSAAWLLEPSNPEELREAWCAAHERGLEPRILGGGANLLVADGEHPWVVISTDRMRRVFRPLEDDEGALDGPGAELAPLLPDTRRAPRPREDDPRLVAWCGAGLLGLVRMTQELGWSGFEDMAGVPGSLGGGLAMNAGGNGWGLWDQVERVRLLTPEGELLDLARGECSPGYRTGGLGDRLVVGAVLHFDAVSKVEVKERVREYLTRKRATQPVTERSCGCIFKNPDPELSEGRSAGALVDQAGLKGLEHGGAQVSPLHGNFIINQGTATAGDVFGLIEEVRERVAQRFGLSLEREVQTWEAGH